MMLLSGERSNGMKAIALVLEPVDLHMLAEHGDHIHVPLEDVGVEGIEFDVFTGTQEELEDMFNRLELPYEKIEKEYPDGE